MSIYSKVGSAWSVESPKVDPEPFEGKPIKECKPSEIEAKINYLERNILVCTCECEALEMYSIKLKPDLMEDKQIDVSWMPYDFSKYNYEKSVVKVPKVMHATKRRMSSISRSGNMLYTIQTSFNTNKININHFIYLLKKILMVIDIDWNKHYSEIQKEYDKCIAQMECIIIEQQKTQQYIESYKTEILVGGLDPLTKRIPSEKYLRFLKRQLMTSNITLSEINLKVTKAITEYKKLEDVYMNMKETLRKIDLTDTVQETAKNKNLYRDIKEVDAINQQIGRYRKNIFISYLKKKNELKKFELGLGLELLDEEINHFKKKTSKTPLIIDKLTEENDMSNENDIVSSKKNAIEDEINDNDELNSNNITDNRINHYIYVKNQICQSDKNIKCIEGKLKRQNEIINYYCQKLKIRPKIKRFYSKGNELATNFE